MSTTLQDSPKRRSRRWLALWLVLLVSVALGVSAWVASNRSRPPSEDSKDLELIFESALSAGRLNANEVRAQIGDERFWRAIKAGIQDRPTEWEAGVWERLKWNGRFPAWFQVMLDEFLSPFEKRWKRRDQRLNTALSNIMWNLKKTATPVLPELIGLAGSRRDNYALLGIQGLLALQEEAAPALPLLFRRLERAENFPRRFADAIQAIDPDGDQTSLRFVELLPRITAYQRSEILPVLGSRARQNPELATNLWPALQDPDQNVVIGAMQGLGRAGLLTAAYLEPHRVGFHSTDAHTRWLSLNLVAHSGVNAAGFVPELRAVGLHKGPDQYAALSGLTMVLFSREPPTEQRFAAAEALLASDSAPNALSALRLLEDFGARWPQLVALITGALAHPDAEVRAEAARHLGVMGPAARPALPQLRALRQDPEKQVRDAVELALPKIGE